LALDQDDTEEDDEMAGGTTLCPVCNGKCVCVVCGGEMRIFKVVDNEEKGFPCPVCCGDPNKNDRMRGVCQNCEGVGTVDKPRSD
jgi:hypothetical protein